MSCARKAARRCDARRALTVSREGDSAADSAPGSVVLAVVAPPLRPPLLLLLLLLPPLLIILLVLLLVAGLVFEKMGKSDSALLPALPGLLTSQAL